MALELAGESDPMISSHALAWCAGSLSVVCRTATTRQPSCLCLQRCADVCCLTLLSSRTHARPHSLSPTPPCPRTRSMQWGKVHEVILWKSRATGNPQGCAFVFYDTREEAEQAIAELDRKVHLPGASRPLEVSLKLCFSHGVTTNVEPSEGIAINSCLTSALPPPPRTNPPTPPHTPH